MAGTTTVDGDRAERHLSGLAVVTGAAQGIGEAVARRLARAGAVVAVCDVAGDRATEIAADIERDGGRARGVAMDVADEQSVADGFAAVADLGPLRTWVNNAGISRPAMLHEMSVADFDAVVSVHLRGTFLGMRQAARAMLEHGTGGSIVNVTSSAGLGGTVGQANYAAAKAGIVGMTKSGAKELGRRGIRVNAVSPAAATEMTRTIRTVERFKERYLSAIALRRWAETEEVAEAFLFLAGDQSSYVTGQVLCCDGGTYYAS